MARTTSAPVHRVQAGFRERLRAVDDCEHGVVGAQATVAHLGEQRGAARGVLRRALAHAEYVLGALRIEAERDEHHVVVADVDAVDHQHDEIDRAEIAAEPLRHLLLGGRDEAAADGAAAGAACDELVGHGLQRARVVPRRHADEHQLDSALVQRIFRSEREPARQLDLATVDGACTWAANLRTTTAEHQLAGGEPSAVRLSPRQVRVAWSDELRPLVLQHGADRGGARGDHELGEVGADHVGERELHDRFYFLELLLPGSVLHGGPSG